MACDPNDPHRRGKRGSLLSEEEWAEWEKNQTRRYELTPEQRAEDDRLTKIRQKRAERATDVRKRFPKLASVTPIADSDKQSAPYAPPAVPLAPGAVELAVRAQCQPLPAAGDRPATVAQAIALAKILDNPAFAPMHATTSRQLNLLLTSLDDGHKKKTKGKLGLIVAMTPSQKKAAN
jgi:hypothetical protein